ncbi:methyl-accepting chemotaxis protein [Brachyspira pilosicoli]|uniref:Methyl-accepting chemotaxis protein n=1 Tax=Brachyspira pilosicoli TaxID=52584 RepID=A0A5C8EXL4_BRAPL|nr:methyl-accepting chemotaxis protein [Brachyspira pilosicoli]TXJ41824.1 methyl-accepting chemotaxis protein [Brachyspira pilosicoli]
MFKKLLQIINNTFKGNSLVLKFLIPYITCIILICIAIYFVYAPQYRNTYQTNSEYNTEQLKKILENNVENLIVEINLLSAYLEKEDNNDKALEVFQNVLKNNSYLVNIFYSDVIPYNEGGFFINANNESLGNYNPTSDQWFKDVMSNNKIITATPYIKNNKTIASFAKAVYKNNRVYGVLLLDIDFDKFIQSTIAENKKHAYNIYIINDAGLFLFSSNKNDILKNNIFSNPNFTENKNNILNNNNFTFINNKLTHISSKIKDTNWIFVADISKNELNAMFYKLYILIAVVFILLIGIEAILVIVIAKPLSTTLNSTVKIIETMSDCNFNIEFNEKELSKKDQAGELVRALNKMQKTLGKVIYNLTNSINEINNSVNSITDGSVNLSDRANSQASALEELASSIQSVSDALKETASNASNAKRMSEEVFESTKRGVDAVEDTSRNMEDIAESSKKVSDIIKIIESIALQTNILALNASVEAARAGEQGKGFAVVANEVRSLANNVANAAKDISDIINDTVRKIELGSTSVKASSYILNQIEKSVNEVSNLLVGISNAIINEEESISQINSAVAELNNITQETSAIAEQGAINSSNALDKAENIVVEVSQFKF